MKKLLALILALCLLLVCGGALAEEKVFKISSIPEGIGDKVAYPWQNMSLLEGLMWRTMFLAETDLTTLKDDLAKADYQLSEDRLTYTFELTEGNKWSDGEPITAEDIVFSIKLNLRAAISNGIFTTAFSKIEGADAYKAGETEELAGVTVDGSTITMKLTSPYSALTSVLAQFAIMPEHVLREQNPLEFYNSEFWTKPVTSGMYRLDEMNVGNYFSLVPNEQYNGVAPKIQKIVNYYANDTLIAAQSGNMYYMNTNVPAIIAELGKLDSMTMYPVDILFFRYFICNMQGTDGNENPAMQDVRVRQAILHAIDRETLVNSLFPGLANVLHSGVPSSYAEYNGVEFEYNPEKAKQLLTEAGYDFSRPFRILYYYSDQNSIDFMEAIAYYLGEVGLTVELTQSSQGTTDLFQTRAYDVGYKGLSAFNISEWYGEYGSTHANFRNIFGGDTAFDELITEYAAAGSAEEASATLVKLEEKEQELLYKLPLFTLGNNVFVNTACVQLQEDQTFGNPWYRTDIGFENWELK